MLPGHYAGLAPLSPDSLKDGLILLPRLSSGPRGIRTLGLLNAIETRSQLRYGPQKCRIDCTRYQAFRQHALALPVETLDLL